MPNSLKVRKKIISPKVVMFHHFHKNENKKYVKNSMNAKDFERLIKRIGLKNILSAEDWYKNLKSNKLKKNHFCFTFDDGLKSQYDVAFPILRKYNIKCFWFIFTSIFSNDYDQNEINKYFYYKYFKDFDEFFYHFKNEINFLKRKKLVFSKLKSKKAINYFKKFKIYSQKERIYRYLRDNVFTNKELIFLHKRLFKKFNFDKKKIASKLWISKKNLRTLVNDNQIIGLHSHNHSSNISSKNFLNQYRDYKKNLDILKKYSNKKIFSSSHPFNSYDKKSLKVLKDLGISLSFRSVYDNISSDLTFPRIDHSKL